MSCSDKFWLENLGSLFSSIQVVPHVNMNLSEQLNSTTRLVLILAIIMWLFDFKYGLHFLIISLLFIIIIYYIQRNTMQRCKENYQSPCPRQDVFTPQPLISNIVSSQSTMWKDGTKVAQVTLKGDPIPFCNDSTELEPPYSDSISLNQNLTKKGHIHANPKTLIRPVVVPPAYDLESWRDNNLITMSMINSPGIQQDMYLSGYAESTCCGYIDNNTELVPRPTQKIQTVVKGQLPEHIVEDYCPGSIVSPMPAEDKPNILRRQVRENYCPGSIVSPMPAEDKPNILRRQVRENYCPGSIVSPMLAEDRPNILRQYREDYLETVDNASPIEIQPNHSGWVNTVCGYNPEQVKVGLPSNYPAGNCEQDPSMTQYNRNLFTQTVTPGVYTINQVNEPINSNIGISFTQQFEPVTVKRDEKGLTYTQHDPRIIEPALDVPVQPVGVNYDNVYDPRFYGYGTSYRSYLEPVTGQTRFMYDDVNAIRMPNYVTRSKIDHLPYADHYGPVEAGSEFGNAQNANIRYLAQDSWLRDSLQFRDDLQERRMRKINAEGWQKRMYPNSARPVGSSIKRR